MNTEELTHKERQTLQSILNSESGRMRKRGKDLATVHDCGLLSTKKFESGSRALRERRRSLHELQRRLGVFGKL